MSSEDKHQERFAQIVSQYQAELRKFIGRYIRNTIDIEDCIQEALLNIWRQEQRGILRQDIRGYVFVTALNVIRDFRRKEIVRQRKTHIELEVAEDEAPMRIMNTEEQFAHREAIRLIETNLDKLEPSTRAVFLLYYTENLTIAQIPARLGISLRTTEREMARALEFYRSTLGDIVKELLDN